METKQAEIGDFLWSLEDRILDFVALRIKEEDFDKDEYELTLSRLKKMNCQNTIVIIESQNKQITDTQ